MKSNELNPIQRIMRCLLLISVLTGMFFSSAEGVRLLPYPVSAANPEKQSSIKTRSAGTYNLSVHNSTNLHANNFKTQRSLKYEINCFFFYHNKSYNFDISAHAAIESENRRKDFFSSGFFDSSFDRGPPAV